MAAPSDPRPTQVLVQRRRAQRTSAFNTFLLIALLAGLVAISLPTCILLFFGMLPTWVAYIVDRTRGKYAARCVGGINFSGVAPYALGLWGGDNSIGDAITVLLDPIKLMVMYGAAGMGWILYLGMPPVVGTFLNIMAQRRVAELQAKQAELVEEWGREIAGGGRPTASPTPAAEGTEEVAESADSEEETVT
ncbi:MAG: acyl-CoA synthetase [Proteobacteria bacterium]|nr:acyl-CoA synthetase [Pseudomonadota bacterium]